MDELVHSEHCAAASYQMLSVGTVASISLEPVKYTVAKPIRLPARVIVYEALHLLEEQPQVFVVVASG